MGVQLSVLEKMLASGQESDLLFYSLGNEYLNLNMLDNAEKYLRQSLEMNPKYSAAWKLLGKVLTAEGKNLDAIETFTQGIQVAEERGDIQAAKEMKVFRKRLMSTTESN